MARTLIKYVSYGWGIVNGDVKLDALRLNTTTAVLDGETRLLLSR